MVTFSPTPTQCDVCTDLFNEAPGTLIYDTNVMGRWGCICHKCFVYFGCTLGIGRGQKYERQANGTFLQTAGGLLTGGAKDAV